MPAELRSRKQDLETALSSRNLTPERKEALQLELRYTVEEEQYDRMADALMPTRSDNTTRVTSISEPTRRDALAALRQLFKPGYDWDAVKDPVTGRTTWLCRSIMSGVYGADVNCRCKPQTGTRWGQR